MLPTFRKHASVASGPDWVDNADWMYCWIATILGLAPPVEVLVDDPVDEDVAGVVRGTVYVEIAVVDPATIELRLTAAVES